MPETIAIIGQPGGHAWQAAELLDADADILCCRNRTAALAALHQGKAGRLLLPVYNTREGEGRDFFRLLSTLGPASWVDNVVLPIHLCLGALDDTTPLSRLVGTAATLRQAEEYIGERHPEAELLAVTDMDAAIRDLKQAARCDCGVIEAEEILKARSLVVREREIVAHNRTRYAVLGTAPAPRTGYDATAVITRPLRDRVGLLYDILGEFTRRGINILDLRTDADVKTQMLQIYVEVEGHAGDDPVARALARIEGEIIAEEGALRVLGSFPRVDMRTKLIDAIGFIGTGDMSRWFADRLAGEGYRTLLTGRTSATTPEEMIDQVDVVVVCVPISATVATVARYGPRLRDGQALVLLAGSAEATIAAALEHTRPGVEVMLVHNLWGPRAATMKDKAAVVVRTPRSGPFCSEFEAFLYKHGAHIIVDDHHRHDLLMGVSQKLPSAISLALAQTLAQHDLGADEVAEHATLTSLYTLISMARIHAQHHRTYAEILAAAGDGMAVVRDFIANLQQLQQLAETGDVAGLEAMLAANRSHLTDSFLQRHMRFALAVDDLLTRKLKD